MLKSRYGAQGRATLSLMPQALKAEWDRQTSYTIIKLFAGPVPPVLGPSALPFLVLGGE